MNGIFAYYWKCYGGWKSLRNSPYVLAALMLVLPTQNRWQHGEWWDVVLGVLPNLLGFSIGAFAIFLSFGDEEFRSTIAGDGKNGKSSPYINFCASFFHFVLVQAGALLYAVIAESQPTKALDLANCCEEIVNFFALPLWCFGYFLFLYSITLCVATTAAIFRIARNYDRAVTIRRNNEKG